MPPRASLSAKKNVAHSDNKNLNFHNYVYKKSAHIFQQKSAKLQNPTFVPDKQARGGEQGREEQVLPPLLRQPALSHSSNTGDHSGEWSGGSAMS